MVTFLIILSIVLAVAVIAQLMRVHEATTKMRGSADFLPSDSENKYQASMMLVFVAAYFAFFAWLVWRYGEYLLPEAASEHGAGLDMLMNFNLAVIILVFAITHVFLFYFAYKYVYSSSRKSYYYTHSTKLELLWTTVPAIFLAIIVVYGLSSWIGITMNDPAPNAVNIELYPKQFDWTARYAGNDSLLGSSNYNMISNTNPLGVITSGSQRQMEAELMQEIADLKEDFEAAPEGGIKREEIEETIAKRERQLAKVRSFSQLDATELDNGDDDLIVKTEFYIPVDREVNFSFRSRDVIHSAYMPHFRAQMNCVPGMVTNFHFKPTITTDQMREKLGDPEFEYYLLCNKICGAAHYNMKMVIKVVDDETYNKWLHEQKTFADIIGPVDANLAAN